MTPEYRAFLESKAPRAKMRGLDHVPDLAAHLFPFQRHVTDFALRCGASGCFLDCISSSAKIAGPFGSRPIGELATEARSILVYALAANATITTAWASAPFYKGRAKLYRIALRSGRSIEATAGHHLLTEAGWLSVSELSRHCSVVSVPFPLASNLELSRVGSPEDGRRSAQIAPGFQGCCSSSRHPCDGPLRRQSGADLELAPLRGGDPAPARSYSLADDQGSRPKHNHRHLDSDLPSRPSSGGQDCCEGDVPVFQLPSFGSGSFEPNIHTVQIIASAGTPARSNPVSHSSEGRLCAGDRPWLVPSFDPVISVKYIGEDDFFDMHVPGYANYFSNGMCSHNTGLGKSEIALEFCQRAIEATNERALILTPLAVAAQFKRRADRWGYEARVIREQHQAKPGINICNYDRLDKLDPTEFGIVVLDEASILKSFTGKTTRALIEAFRGCRFKLAATATPAPNDHMELGNYGEFLDIMSANEMLSRFFINDTSTASQEWRLKGHAVEAFWDWMASWTRMAEKPSDLGDDDARFILPPLNVTRHRARNTDIDRDLADMFGAPVMSATSLHDVKRQTIAARAEMVGKIVSEDPNQPWLIWVDTNYEADALLRELPDTIEVRGSQSIEEKEEKLEAFATGKVSRLIAKPSQCGFGLDWSHCARMVFAGRSYSYEVYYQAVRRCWRFGQTRPVGVHLVVAEGEDAIGSVIDRKADDHASMKLAMREAMRRASGRSSLVKVPYNPQHTAELAPWISAA